jgi:signal transduction histidine kinase
MAALGKFSAGLAHELNNPAAAASRAANTLRGLLPTLQTETMRLCALGLPSEAIDCLVDYQAELLSRAAADKPVLTPIERGDREDEIASWLDEQNVENSWDIAPTFVEAGLSLPEVIEMGEKLPSESLPAVFAWFNQVLTAGTLLDTVDQSSHRISDLVKAIKEYTYMDQAPRQEIDVHQGLENTLRVMNHKLKKVRVIRQFDPTLPRIMAHGSELNQVWTNLIDNAVDAMKGEGEIKVITRCEDDFAMVEITDNGPGIPSDVLPHIFEPFFTTKDVGLGTGLGLDTVYRIIKAHNGTIEVQSKAGHTRFIVRIPVQG